MSINGILDILIEKCIEVCISLGKKRYDGRVQTAELRKSVSNFFESNLKEIDNFPNNSQIDYQGLINYFDKSLDNDIEDALFNQNSVIRKNKRDEIVSKSIYSAQVTSNNEIDFVRKFVFDYLDIVKDFYKRKIDKKYWLLEDELISKIEDITIKENDKLYNSIVDTLSFERNIIDAAKNRNYGEIEGQMHLLNEKISLEHPLYPAYGFNYLGGKMISVPRSEDAVKQNPPNFLLTGELKVGNEIIGELDNEIVQYADRHQLQIKLTVQEAKKFLGVTIDPIQYEAEDMIGRVLVRNPKPFPPAFPCKIIIDDIVFYDYVELRTKEILDDGTFVIENYEQTNCPIKVTIKIKFDNSINHNSVNYKMSIKDASNVDLLNYLKMMNQAAKGGMMQIYMLNDKLIFLEGKLTPFKYNGGFTSAEEEIDFLKRVVNIEEYFDDVVTIPEKINKDDYDSVIYLSNLIRGVAIKNTWDSISISFKYSDKNSFVVEELDGKEFRFMFSGTLEINLFEKDYSIDVAHICNCAVIKDVERIKKRLQYTDEGETVDINLVAGKDNIYIEKIVEDDIDTRSLYIDILDN